MKIAITSQGNSRESIIDSRFGRCSYFAIYDTEDKSLKFIENPNREVQEGAGPASVSLVAKEGVNKIISGNFGTKIISLLNGLNIQMLIEKNKKTIQEIIISCE